MSNIKIEQVPIECLAPSDFNVNVVSPDNEAKIDASIVRFGFFKPVLCREVGGRLQIIGGEHRWLSAKRLGYKEVPVINLGPIDDKRAKEISLADNSRYGADDTLQLAELLEGLGNAEELGTFLPYSDTDFASIFSSVSIALDDLEISDDEPAPKLPTERAVQTHQLMRMKVPSGDVAAVTELIAKVMKLQRFTEEDSLTNAGNALVHICNLAKDLA